MDVFLKTHSGNHPAFAKRIWSEHKPGSAADDVGFGRIPP